MPDGLKEELKLLRVVGIKLTGNIRKELVKQGHHLTGALEDSVHGTAFSTGRETYLVGNVAYYGAILDAGVTATRIPFKEGSGSGHSKYIDGLISYFRLKGLSEKEATSAAFATAKTHKKEGMPSAGSYKYSKTGQRTQFIQAVEKAIGTDVQNMITDGLDRIIDAKFNETKSETI